MVDCKCCNANETPDFINPVGPIIVGQFWIVEHAFPSSRLGWLILRLKRHSEALHDLSKDEFSELGNLQFLSIQTLNVLFDTEKEYISCFSEAEEFKHIHFHIAPKPKSSNADEIGILSFRHLKPSDDNKIQAEDIREFGRQFRIEFERTRKNSE